MLRHCSRPGCNAAADAAFNFDGLRRIVWLNPLRDVRDHSAGDLCAPHADRLRPPLRWELRDLRHATAAGAEPDRPRRPAPSPLGAAARDRSPGADRPEPATPLLARAFRAAG